MGRIKKFIILAIVIFIFSGCAETQSYSLFNEESSAPVSETPFKQPEVILLSHSESEDSLVQVMALEFKRVLEESSNGEFEVAVYPNSTLGNVNTGLAALDNGTVEMRVGGCGSKILEILSWSPSLFDVDLNKVYEQLKPGTPLRSLLEEEYDNTGRKILAVLAPSYRMLTSKKEINSIDDFYGLKTRVVFNGILADYWRSLGMETCVYDIDMVYTALQQDIFDSQENTIANIIGYKLYEQQKYLIFTDHQIDFDSVFISGIYYDSLSEEKQNLIKEAVDQAVTYANSKTEAYMEDALQYIGSNLELIHLSESVMQEIRNIVKPIVTQYLYDSYGESYVNELLQYIK